MILITIPPQIHLIAVTLSILLLRPISGSVKPVLRRENEDGSSYRQLYTGTARCQDVFLKPWVETTVRDLSVEEKIKTTIAFIDENCTRLEDIEGNKSWAEKALENKGANYGPRFKPTSTPFRDPKDFRGGFPTHIEIICIALGSRGAADLEDAEGLTEKVQTGKTCDAFQLYNPRYHHCLDVNENGNARAAICSPREIKDETFTYNETISVFQLAEESLDHMHGIGHCWFRENVLPHLVKKHCRDDRYPGKVRGAVRVGKVIDVAKWCGANDVMPLFGRCEQNWKVVWVFDLAVSA